MEFTFASYFINVMITQLSEQSPLTKLTIGFIIPDIYGKLFSIHRKQINLKSIQISMTNYDCVDIITSKIDRVLALKTIFLILSIKNCKFV